MNAALTVVFPGAFAGVQDLGRNGLRRVGVPRAGALQPFWLRLANVLAANPPGHPAIEFFGGGLVLRAEEAPLRLAFAGSFDIEILGGGQEVRKISSWRSVILRPGERLRCGMTCGARVGYVAVHGLTAPQLLGSAATYARAGLGRLLAAGDCLPAATADDAVGLQCRDRHGLDAPCTLPIRVVPGPQADWFDSAAYAAFCAQTYRVTAESDRMGMRLLGEPLAHRAGRHAEITSDATVPGSIQVPGNGQPIVLLNDGQTAGGYPKIGTVISADLPYLAALPAGSEVRFTLTGVAEAELAARERARALAAAIAAIAPVPTFGEVDLAALYADNLLSGVVDALAAE